MVRSPTRCQYGPIRADSLDGGRNILMRSFELPSSKESDSVEEYRLLCTCCSQIPLQLNAEQIGLLADQTGFGTEQAHLAAQLIQRNQVPRWYVWRGFPETHNLQTGPFDTRVSHGSPHVGCDCGEEGCGDTVEIGGQHIISIPLTREQQAAIRDGTGRATFALECSAEVLNACVRATRSDSHAIA